MTVQDYRAVNIFCTTMQRSSSTSSHSKRRRDTYDEVFTFQSNETMIDINTGLLSSKSLNHSLYQYLQLSDKNWVLAMIDIDG